MEQVKYGIRSDWNKFGADLVVVRETIKGLKLQSFKDDYPHLVKSMESLRFLRDMCKDQSLNVIGSEKSVLLLGSCANKVDTIRNVFIENEGFDSLKTIQSSIVNTLDNVVKAVNLKADAVLIENYNAQPEEPSEDGAFKTLSGAMQALKTDRPKTPEEINYETINQRLAKEKALIQPLIDSLKKNRYVEFTGSVAVNHFFREQSLEGLDYSIIKGKGFEFSRSRRETVTPMHIFHGQKLVAIKLKVGKFIFSRKELTPNEIKHKRDTIFQSIREQALEDYPDMIELTQDIEPGYLYSKAFKGILFLWFVSPKMRTILDRFPENKVSLMWAG